MARSYSSTAGLPNPLAIGAVALVVMASLYGSELGLVSGGAPASQLDTLSGLNAELAPDAPQQAWITAPEIALGTDGLVATPNHRFSAEALVLSRKAYRFDDEAAISPLDLMLGWGPMSNPAVIAEVGFRQSGRFGYVRHTGDGPLDLGALSPFWSNVHLIPASPAVAEAFNQIAEGHVIRIEGVLTDVTGPNGWQWRTSTSRTDKGAGACEILLVTLVEVIR